MGFLCPVQKDSKTWNVQPVSYGACSSYFKNASLMDLVMQSEAEVIKKYDLGSCCS